MAIRVIDDSKLQDIAVAIQGKDGGGQMTVDEMPTRITAIPTGEPIVQNPALALMDWEGTILKEYSKEDALALTELPAPSSLSKYANVDHDLLTFQEWTRNLTNIKTWVRNHSDQPLGVGAIYTTTDGQDHDYFNNPRLTNAKSIYMQKRGATSIGNNAFDNCYSLTAINIPDGVTSIGGNAFQNCYSLTAINIPDGVTSIGNNAFDNCYSLTAINIPDGVTSIESHAFQNCNSLTAINIPDGVTLIGGNAFYNCYSLTAINIPDGVTSIDGFAFYNCYSLTAINIPDGVTSIESHAFQNCNSLTAINIPDGVTSIDGFAFQNCYSLTAINIPDGVTSIGNNAFDNCYSLTAINIPDGVTSIDGFAFYNCYSLTAINIPDGVTLIGNNAFQNCRELYDVVIHGKPALSNTNAFVGAPSTQKLYVHRSDLSWFETKTNWSTIYAQGKIVAAADYLDYLISIGVDVTDFENEVISE